MRLNMLCCRGLATFKEVQPDYAQEFRMMRGKGGIVGLYPLDPLRVYYFHAFAVSEAGPACIILLDATKYCRACMALIM